MTLLSELGSGLFVSFDQSNNWRYGCETDWV